MADGAWSSVVFASDLSVQGLGATAELEPDGLVETTKLTMPRGALLGALSVSTTVTVQERGLDRKSVVEGKSVDLGGRRIIKKKKLTVLVASREVGTGV